jgi:hypothetical protein
MKADLVVIGLLRIGSVLGRCMRLNPLRLRISIGTALLLVILGGSPPSKAAPLDQTAAFSFEIERSPEGPVCPGEIIMITVTPKLVTERSGDLGNVLVAPVTAEVRTPSGQDKPIPAFDEDVDSIFKTTFLIQFSEVGTHYLTVQLTMRDISAVEGMGDMTIEEAAFSTDFILRMRRFELRRAITSKEEIEIEVIPCKIRVWGYHIGFWRDPFTGSGFGIIGSVDLVPDNKAVYTGSSEFTYNGDFLYSTAGCYSKAKWIDVKGPVTLKAEIRASYIFIRISFGAGVGRIDGEAACGGAFASESGMWENAIGAAYADGTMAVPLKPGFQLKADFPVGAYIPQLGIYARIIRE